MTARALRHVFPQKASTCPARRLWPLRLDCCDAFVTAVAVLHQLAAACHLDSQFGDLLAQSIAIDPEQVGAAGLVAACRVEGDFDQRLRAVIDELLATPDVSGPLRLIKPEAYYLYADEELESLTAGQKILLRMGPDNAARVKAKLAEIRDAL